MDKLLSTDQTLLDSMFDAGTDEVHTFPVIFRDKHLLLVLPKIKKHALRAITLYQPQSLKARVYICYAKWLIRLGLARFLPKVKLGKLKEDYIQLLGSTSEFGLLLGNPNSDSRKIITYHYSNDNSLVSKIGVNMKSAGDIVSEYECLEKVSKKIPSSLKLIQSFCSESKDLAYFSVKWIPGRSPRRKDYDKVCNLLTEWISKESCQLTDFDGWKVVLEKCNGSVHSSAIESLNNKSLMRVPIHGDFAPWNIKIGVEGEVFTLDWESYQIDGAAGWDWAHFLIQSKLLIDKMYPHEVIESALYWAKSDEGVEFLDACGWGRDHLSWIGSYLFYAQYVLGFDREELIECWKEKVEMSL